MRSPRRVSGDAGPAIVALSGLGLLASLWQPFYTLRVPGQVLEGLDRLSGQFGILGPVLRQGTGYLRHAGPLDVSAWQAFRQTDAVLLLVAVVAVALGLLALTERARGAGPLIAALGLLAAALVVFRMIDPVGPGDFVKVAWGARLALGCALGVAAGGALTSRREAMPAPAPPPAPPEWPAAAAALQPTAVAPSHSVAPPGL